MEQAEEDLNLSFLLEHERETILKVLQKDEKLRKREEKRIRKLKNELLEIKRKGSRRTQERAERGERQCARCLKTLGLLFDRGDVCEECQLRVCGECRVSNPGSRQWRCSVCAKISELKVVTGEWFLEERSKRFEQKVPSGDVIKQTILSSPLWGGGSGVLRFARGAQQPASPNPGQAVHSQQQPEGQGQRPTHTHTHTHTHRPRASEHHRLTRDCLWTQPDGAESVASLRSSDGASERKDGGAPSISVSRASVSSGLSLLFFLLPSSHGEVADFVSPSSSSRPLFPPPPSSSSSSSSPTSTSPASASQSSINSMMSMYSETGDYGNARVSGEILLNISYSYKTGALNVLVKECHNLATGDERRQRTDAYVKTYLLPDTSRQSKRKTSIKANTINPVFNENLRYVISHSQLETRTLQVSVWHHDRFGHNSFLGEVELTFDSWEFDSQMEDWYTLQPKMESCMDSTMQYKGELTVVLKYIPAEKNLMLPLDQVQVKKSFLRGKKTSSFTLPKGGMVELLVKGAKNLTAVKSGGTSDPFVKGYLLPDSNKSTKHKTAVERRTVNPQWNHTFTYCGLQPGDLNNVCLELTVWDKEALASNVFLGGVRLGAGTGKSYGNEVDWMDSYGEEQRLWQRMIENPEVPHECTLMLRSSMRRRST
uniref:Synaptotagmin-like protein 5 n=1 Tax=Salarias fasciatus TaxID=181472 RepID=A0A672GT95_SALFA